LKFPFLLTVRPPVRATRREPRQTRYLSKCRDSRPADHYRADKCCAILWPGGLQIAVGGAGAALVRRQTSRSCRCTCWQACVAPLEAGVVKFCRGLLFSLRLNAGSRHDQGLLDAFRDDAPSTDVPAARKRHCGNWCRPMNTRSTDFPDRRAGLQHHLHFLSSAFGGFSDRSDPCNVRVGIVRSL